MNFLLAALLSAAAAAAQDYSLPPPPAPSTATRHLEFTADRTEYDGAAGLIHMKGGVKLVESTWTVKADELWLDTKTRTVRSPSYLLVEDGVSAISGESGEYDLQNHGGTLYKSSAGHGDWRIHGRRVHMDAKKRLDYYSADFTSCSFVPPHYHFHATRITVVPHKYLLARNTFFYWHKVPLFYTPFLYKSLKETHFLRFKVQPGYDRRNGVFIKSTLATEHSKNFSSKLYLDYFVRQGLGTGLELNRHGGQDSRGALYGYQISETSTRQERWTVLGTGYHSFASSVSVQGRLQIQSDAAFNNDYNRASLFRVTPELINNGAVVYRMRRSSLRLSYSREEAAAGNGTKFIKQTEDYPKLDFQTQSLALRGLPWLNTFSAFAGNNYHIGRPFLQRSAGGQWEATSTIPILKRRLALTPKATYSQTYLSRFDEPGDFQSTTTVLDAFVGRYGAAPSLRLSSPAGDWDLTQTYLRRQKPGSLADDAGAIDHGVESNMTTIQDSLRPLPRVWARVATGYDERVFRDHAVGFRDRVQPFVADVSYAPRSDLDISLREDYQLNQGERSFIVNAEYGERASGRFLGGGAGYNKSNADQYFFDANFGIAPSSSTWRLTAALRAVAYSSGGLGNLNHPQLFEKELQLTKVWHDFFTRAMIRFRPGGVKEVTFRIDLRLGSLDKAAAKRRDWEAEWFPERRSELTDRP